jgi:alcohol dehydrogenase class IV
MKQKLSGYIKVINNLKGDIWMSNNFRYYMPTELFFGKNIIESNKQLFVRFGKKAFIITYKMSPGVEHKSLQDVLDVLDEQNVESFIETNIEPNPSVETIERVAKIAKNHNVDYLIAIGGGSPIDAAKAIGVLINNPECTGQDLFTNDGLESIPIIAIPTTAGTGAEVTHWSVLTRNDLGTKQAIRPAIFPDIALADPKYLMDMPDGLTKATALDALTHCIESYVSTKGNEISRSFCEAGFKLFSETVEAMETGNLTYKIREKQMLISIYGGFANAQTGTSIAHGMSYALTHSKGVPHGLACGLLIKEYMGIFNDRTRINKILQLSGFKSLSHFGDFIDKMLPIEIDISEKEIDEFSKEFSTQKHRFSRHPEQMGFEEVRKIYRNSLLKKKI